MSANSRVLEQTADYVKKAMPREGAHDWWHVYRVWKTSVKIAKAEGADLFTVQLAALLHDIADWKFHGGNEDAGPRMAREWLQKMNVDEGVIAHVCGIIKDMPFKGAGVKSKMKTLEGAVVQDADRLDAIGAIGVARTFAYGGYKGRELYNPSIKPQPHRSFEEYKNSKGPTINHFYEKLLLLKGRMNTKTAKRIAEKRHKFMNQFLKTFFREWND